MCRPDDVVWLSCDDDVPALTPESIAQAKAARDAERAEITRKTGVVISDDGKLRLGRAIGDFMAFGVYNRERS